MNKDMTKTLEWNEDENLGDIITHRSGANLKIVLNRPRNGNALTTNMVGHLTNRIRQAGSDSTIARIILTANGRFFCTGMDLGKSTTGVGKDSDTATSEFQKFVQLFAAIDQSPKVTIAAINGPCYAGGVGLAFACDIRLCVSRASFTLSEVRLGLCPAIISKYVAREWGLSFTREATLSGRTISVAELKALRAIHVVTEDVDTLQGVLDNYVSELRKSAPKASEFCKRAIQSAYAEAGSDHQDQVIRNIFEEMMGPGAEATIGVSNFQKGIRVTDWDSLRKPAKL